MTLFTRAAKMIVIAAVVGSGTCVAAPAAAAPSKLMTMLPEGFSSSNCQVKEPNAPVIEAVNCDKSSVSGGPTGAGFALYRNLDDLDSAFQATNVAVAPSCPGNQVSPGPWASNGKTGGQKSAEP
jgi:hypothetical protein